MNNITQNYSINYFVMEVLDDLAYEIGKVISKKNSKVYRSANGYVDDRASNFLGQEIIAKVKSHANIATWSGAAGAVSEFAAMGALIASTWKMYYDINEVIGLSFSENFLKSVASGIVSNLASNAAGFAVGYATAAVANKIPGIGSVVGGVATSAANRASIYAAAYSYLQILRRMLDSDDISEAAFSAAMSGDDYGDDYYDDSYSSQDSELYPKVVSIIADKLAESPSRITPNTYLSDLGVDSLDAVELIMEFENQFDISIPDEDVDSIVQVKDIVSYLENYY